MISDKDAYNKHLCCYIYHVMLFQISWNDVTS